MSAALLPRPRMKRLAKLLGMLGSEHPGERSNAAAAADKLVREAGTTWSAVLGLKPQPEPSIAERIAACRARPDLISDWAMDFLDGIERRIERGWTLSIKQTAARDRLCREIAKGG